MVDGTGKGLVFLGESGSGPRQCAFCRQGVGTEIPLRCARCRALYHSDCWAANGQRCAIYGCEPAEKPVPVAAARAPEPYRLPPERSSGFGRGGWIFLIVVIPNVIRLLGSTSTHSRHTTPIEYPPSQAERSSPVYSVAKPQLSLFFDRGCFHYDHQDWKECLSDFELADARESSLEDAIQIRIFFARSRLGESDWAERTFRSYLETRLTPGDRSWQAQSLRFVAGLTTESEYLDNISSEPERACEAFFYAGTRRLIAHDEVSARAYFYRCVATGVETSREYKTAKGELNALRGY